MPKLSKVVEILEEIAPPGLADPDDMGRIGLVVDRGGNVERAGVSLDPTDYVFEEAARLEVDILICHHPLIPKPMMKLEKSLCDKLKIALENEISVYVMHTNFDRADGGINDTLASVLGLTDVERMSMGCIGYAEPSSIEEFANEVSSILGTHVQFAGTKDVERVAVVGGSGFTPELIKEAIEFGADTYVSGELKHHAVRDFVEKVNLVDGTHYYTEIHGMRRLCNILPFECILIEDDPGIKTVW